MTSAPIAQQRLLIDLQDLDSHLARLRHERKHLPVLTRIEAVIERLKANKRAAIQAEAALDEAKKQATRSEDEVGQVVRRAEVLRERLHSGTSAARDLSAIQGEIDQLGQRQSALEEAQILAMEALDSARQEAERLSQEESEIRTAGRELTAKRDAEFARLDEEIESLENPHARGKALTGSLGGLWRYRVGNYRVVCHIQAHVLVVLVVRIGHRRDIYKQT